MQGSILKETILQSLIREDNLTAEQLQRLSGAKLNTVQKALKRLQVEEVLEAPKPIEQWKSIFWRLKGKGELNSFTVRENRAAADLYISLAKSGEDFLWLNKSDQTEGLRFDRAMKYDGKYFAFEIETGSKYDKRNEEIPKKIQQYMKIKGRFFVIFVVMNYPGKTTAANYAKKILNLALKERRGTQFCVASLDGLIDDPFGQQIIDPLGNIYSFKTIK